MTALSNIIASEVIAYAKAQGESAAIACLAKAQRGDPEFSAKAKAAILAHLKVAGSASGEDLVEIAKAKGAIPMNGDKAFGGVFLSLSKSGQIVCLRADLPRKHGHGTSGGKLWGLALEDKSVVKAWEDIPFILRKQAS